MKRVLTHNILAIIVAILAVSTIGFSGYAYASGTNPISLLKRWISGDSIHVTYQGREFRYGKSRTYSDAAVTAFAELRTIDQLAWKAGNAYEIPKNGVEYISNPYNHEYVQPWIGVVERVDGDKVVIREQYIIGDKVTAAQDVDKELTIALANIDTYVEGEPASADKLMGKLVVVYISDYLRYYTGSKKTPQPVIHQFAFGLNHTLADIKEAAQANRPGQGVQTEDRQGVYEASWSGALSDLCGNNAANHCDPKLLMPDAGESFFTCVTGHMQSGTPCGGSVAADVINPNAIPFGEALPDDAARTNGMILRDVEGKVTAINDNAISIKSSAGQIWTLALTTEQRESFGKRTGAPLKVGDRVGAAVISSVNELDNRTFDNPHIYTMKRY